MELNVEHPTPPLLPNALLIENQRLKAELLDLKARYSELELLAFDLQQRVEFAEQLNSDVLCASRKFKRSFEDLDRETSDNNNSSDTLRWRLTKVQGPAVGTSADPCTVVVHRVEETDEGNAAAKRYLYVPSDAIVLLGVVLDAALVPKIRKHMDNTVQRNVTLDSRVQASLRFQQMKAEYRGTLPSCLNKPDMWLVTFEGMLSVYTKAHLSAVGASVAGLARGPDVAKLNWLKSPTAQVVQPDSVQPSTADTPVTE